MLVIRMQRTGRSGHAQFRVVVQDSRRTPTSGRIVAALGSYNPHNKAAILDKDKAKFYLEHGAQPSDRVARLLKSEGVKLPAWVKLEAKKERAVKNADKRRSTRPAEATPAADKPEESAEQTPETPAEEPAGEVPAEEIAAEAPAETPATKEPAKTEEPTVPAEEKPAA